MGKTLADEYHGHQCHKANPIAVDMAYVTYTEQQEDAVADELYMAGQINRAEWLIARERMGKWHG